METERRYLTTGDVAKACGVSSASVKKWIGQAKLRALRTPGRHFRIPVEEFQRFRAAYGFPLESEHAPRILVVDDSPSSSTSSWMPCGISAGVEARERVQRLRGATQGRKLLSRSACPRPPYAGARRLGGVPSGQGERRDPDDPDPRDHGVRRRGDGAGSPSSGRRRVPQKATATGRPQGGGRATHSRAPPRRYRRARFAESATVASARETCGRWRRCLRGRDRAWRRAPWDRRTRRSPSRRDA